MVLKKGGKMKGYKLNSVDDLIEYDMNFFKWVLYKINGFIFNIKYNNKCNKVINKEYREKIKDIFNNSL